MSPSFCPGLIKIYNQTFLVASSQLQACAWECKSSVLEICSRTDHYQLPVSTHNLSHLLSTPEAQSWENTVLQHTEIGSDLSSFDLYHHKSDLQRPVIWLGLLCNVLFPAFNRNKPYVFFTEIVRNPQSKGVWEAGEPPGAQPLPGGLVVVVECIFGKAFSKYRSISLYLMLGIIKHLCIEFLQRTGWAWI